MRPAELARFRKGKISTWLDAVLWCDIRRMFCTTLGMQSIAQHPMCVEGEKRWGYIIRYIGMGCLALAI